MNDRDLEARLRDAYRMEASQADPGALIERVHAIPTTAGPESPRWWHRLGLGALRSAGPDGIKTRGANSMAAVTTIAATVAALALGATFLVGQGDPPERGFSAAAPTDGVWAAVTGTQSLRHGGEGLVGENVDMSDPRLAGRVSITHEQGLPPDDPSGLGSTLWSTVTISNDAGSWHGPSVGFVDDRGVHHHFGWFEGAGEYEGLVFLEQLTEESASAGLDLDIAGLVYEGELPPPVLPIEAEE